MVLLGLLALGVGAMAGLGGLLLSHRTRIIRAFDVGFQAGYRKGVRGQPKVVNFDRSA